MHWHWKALIQHCVAHLPEPLSRSIYFQLQRHFGNLRRGQIDPTNRLRIGFEFCRQIVDQGRSPVGSTFFEVGTGWRLNVPIACWLCGADRIITVDLNSYLNRAAIIDDLLFMRRNEHSLFNQLASEFGSLIQPNRWRQLLKITPATKSELCSSLGIEYVAPADARRTHCDAHSVDFHVSCNVLEHIPEETLRGIFLEARRITRPGGLMLHRVDHTDHFSHADATLPPIHFLQFGDPQWHRYAGHRYAYVNRLREDDYLQIFREVGLDVSAVNSEPDAAVERLLQQDFPLHTRFQGKTHDTLARLTSLFVMSPRATAGVSARAA